MIDHGRAVNEAYETLRAAALCGEYPQGWRQPKWWSPELARELAAKQPPQAIMWRAQRYHDCGKHLCRTVDEQGRQHFPDHARVSAAAWRAAGGDADSAWLIEHDMLLHTGSAADCEWLVGHRLTPALTFTALAELHANAEMFGGIDQSSFKAKFKHYERRTSALLHSSAPAG